MAIVNHVLTIFFVTSAVACLTVIAMSCARGWRRYRAVRQQLKLLREG